MDDVLFVFWNEDFVGQLALRQDDLQFQYSPEWLSSAKTAPISAQLPLRKEYFPDRESRCFFANLLPEGNIRPMIARRLGISDGNDFALLKALGGDCAGALSLWPDLSPDHRPARYDALADQELDSMIDLMESTPLMTSGKDLRLSLAGAQQKIPLMLDADKFFLPHGSAASSHIVKPDIPALPGSSMNEAFCMTLTRHIGLPAAQTHVWRGRHTALIVERYDRQRTPDGRWIRLHQEDLCQALGYPHSKKYEMDGGPGLAKAFGLLDAHSTQPIPDKEVLLRGTIVNACIGNMDAHAKNFSMLIDGKSYRLAPLYDLLSTRIYGSLSPKLAMRIGGQIRPEWLLRTHWEKFAHEAGISPARIVYERVQETTEKLPGACAAVRKQFEPTEEENVMLDKLIRHITTTCAVLERGLKKTG